MTRTIFHRVRRMIAADAFVQTILEQPDADAPRLVYADWLEERGDPQAELIRTQCELARVPDGHPRQADLRARQQQLLAEQGERWLAPVKELGLSARFRRGFLEVQVSGVRALLDAGNWLFAHPWVLHVARLGDAAADLEDIAELAASPHLARVQKLDLSRSDVRNEGVQKLARSPFRPRPTYLLLNHIQLSSAGLCALLDGMDLSRLVELHLYGNGIGAAGARALSLTPKLNLLRVLDLSYNSLRTVGGEYLAESLYLGQLQSLFVRGNSIGTRGRKALRRRFGPRVHLGSAESPF